MKILVFPHDTNPYQDLLYKEFNKQTTKVTYVKNYPYVGALFFPLVIFIRRLQGYKLIHIHWPAFTIGLPLPYKKQLSYGLYKLSKALIKGLGFKVVWTVHNILPHESQTSNDLGLSQSLSRLADAKIIHASYAIRQMKEYGLSTADTTIIPHGNYIGVYPDLISRTNARRKLNIKNHEFVILFFGLIRPYKGVDHLLGVFKEIKLQNKRLIIAGKCLDERLHRQITEMKADGSNIDFFDSYVADEDVATYFKACDVVCLPFKSITTSGSVILALSFGKPIVAPLSGALNDLPKTVGYLYDPTQTRGLIKSLQRASKDGLGIQEKSKAAYAYAKTLNWDKIAAQTSKLYQDVLNEE